MSNVNIIFKIAIIYSFNYKYTIKKMLPVTNQKALKCQFFKLRTKTNKKIVYKTGLQLVQDEQYYKKTMTNISWHISLFTDNIIDEAGFVSSIVWILLQCNRQQVI